MTKTIRAAALAAVAGLALTACQKPAPAVDAAKEAQAIQAQVDLFNAAVKAGDAEKATSIDAPDIRGYGGGPDITSAAQDLTVTKALMHDPAFAFAVKTEHTEVAKSGEMAVLTGTYEGASTNPQTKAVDHAAGHWVAEWRKDDQGRWKLAAVSTASPPPPAAAAK
jgi:ketosteroid isomerase-like protein